MFYNVRSTNYPMSTSNAHLTGEIEKELCHVYTSTPRYVNKGEAKMRTPRRDFFSVTFSAMSAQDKHTNTHVGLFSGRTKIHKLI